MQNQNLYGGVRVFPSLVTFGNFEEVAVSHCVKETKGHRAEVQSCTEAPGAGPCLLVTSWACPPPILMMSSWDRQPGAH